MEQSILKRTAGQNKATGTELSHADALRGFAARAEADEADPAADCTIP